MKKLLLILFIVPLFSSFSYETNESNHSLNVSSIIEEPDLIIEEPDFRGIWLREYGTGYYTIWINKHGEYEVIYLDNPSYDYTETLSVELKEGKLIVESILLEQDWRTKKVISVISENTLKLEGINDNGTYSYLLNRVDIVVD